MIVRYEAVITGDRPPYKWQVRRYNGSTSQLLDDKIIGAGGKERSPNTYEGYANTREEALFASRDAAQAHEDERVYDLTVEAVPLFQVDTEATDD